MEEENNQFKKLVIKILKYTSFTLFIFALVLAVFNYKKLGNREEPSLKVGIKDGKQGDEIKPSSLPECDKDDSICLSYTQSELEDPDKQYRLGVMNERPQVDCNYAVAWYTKAAEQGHIKAQRRLGEIYAHGLPNNNFSELPLGRCGIFRCCEFFDESTAVPKDLVKAIEWYTKAAEQGDVSSQLFLVAMYAEGHGVAKDIDKAKALFPNVKVQDGLKYAADKYYRAQDYKMAYKLYSKAAEFDPDVYEELGNMMMPLGYRVAVELYVKAPKYKDAVSQYNKGSEIAKSENYALALEWWREAAENGHTEAQYKLGLLFFEGKGTNINYAEAKRWIEEAAKNGHKDAIKFLEEHADKFRKIPRSEDRAGT